MRTVLQNLIDNALKYTPAGGTITVTLRRADGHVVIAIADTGIGIPDRQQTNIFTRFFRGDNAIKMQTDGSGLGLYIVKSLVEHHGGTVEFTSTEGHGSTFTIRLPLKNTNASAYAQASQTR